MLRAPWISVINRTLWPPLRLNLKVLIIIAFGSLTFLWFNIHTSSSVSWSKSAYKQISQISWSDHSKVNKPQASLEQRRFLVRDWTPWLGWNNFRYTIETALVLAELLNRELVIPAFTYATACEYDDQVCAKLTPFFVQNEPIDLKDIIDRSQYPDPDEGTTILKPLLPSQQWKGWVLPIDNLLDVNHTIATWNHSIRFEDYLRLTSPLPHRSIGMSTGKWSELYNNGLSYRKVPNVWFTNFSLTMVDRLPPPVTPLIDPTGATPPTVPPQVITRCQLTLNKLDGSIPQRRQKRTETDSSYPSWDDGLISGEHMTGVLGERDHPLLERCIASHGMRTAYGFTMDGWWMKAPYGPTKYIRRLSKMVGFWDLLHAYDEQILHIEGELHNGYPPASMIWTSLEGREKYRTLVRSAIKPPEIYDKVAARLELRMRARCGGRSWRASHMRRGDFLGYEWASKDIAKQWNWIEHNAAQGASLIENQPSLLIPAHKAYGTSLLPPKPEDPIYLATNTRSPDELQFLRGKNVVLLNDLIQEEDRVELGFKAKFMDTLAVLEQCLIMRAGFFYGDAHSSLDGLILNRRVHFGIDEQLTKIQYLKLPGDGQ